VRIRVHSIHNFAMMRCCDADWNTAVCATPTPTPTPTPPPAGSQIIIVTETSY